ncbi:MAG: hypothetical protein VKO21_04610 [Candidatus Sericytochromatia bacterium]|nr:hypothetical protein [Candidatus Sericytochromatia bacterium]
MERLNGWLRVPVGLAAGAVAGAAFGAAFGWMASWFAMGPDAWQGVRESAPWFAVVGATAGFLLGLERSDKVS